MIKKVVAVTGLVAMVAFSGCSSDTKESLEAEKNELIKKCTPLMMGSSDKDLREECEAGEKDIKARMKALIESEK